MLWSRERTSGSAAIKILDEKSSRTKPMTRAVNRLHMPENLKLLNMDILLGWNPAASSFLFYKAETYSFKPTGSNHRKPIVLYHIRRDR